MSEMTVNEIRQKKSELHDELLKLIEGFKRDTGLRVLAFHYQYSSADDNSGSAISIEGI